MLAHDEDSRLVALVSNLRPGERRYCKIRLDRGIGIFETLLL